MTTPQTPQPPGRSIRYTLVALFASMLLLTLLDGWWANYKSDQALHQANANATATAQQWCDLLNTIRQGNRTLPPTSPTGRLFAREVEQLAERFNCPPLGR